jgi:hypothetical protein
LIASNFPSPTTSGQNRSFVKIALAVTVVKFLWDLWQTIVNSRASRKGFVTAF